MGALNWHNFFFNGILKRFLCYLIFVAAIFLGFFFLMLFLKRGWLPYILGLIGQYPESGLLVVMYFSMLIISPLIVFFICVKVTNKFIIKPLFGLELNFKKRK
jgi:hypothetical protein